MKEILKQSDRLTSILEYVFRILKIMVLVTLVLEMGCPYEVFSESGPGLTAEEIAILRSIIAKEKEKIQNATVDQKNARFLNAEDSNNLDDVTQKAADNAYNSKPPAPSGTPVALTSDDWGTMKKRAEEAAVKALAEKSLADLAAQKATERALAKKDADDYYQYWPLNPLIGNFMIKGNYGYTDTDQTNVGSIPLKTTDQQAYGGEIGWYGKPIFRDLYIGWDRKTERYETYRKI